VSAGGDVFVKRQPSLPDGWPAAEAAGLRWLAAAVPAGGVPVPDPLQVRRDVLVLPRLRQVAPSPASADDLGRRLAVMHAAGAPAFGAGPPGWRGDAWIGLLPLPLRPTTTWGAFYAADRLLPYARRARDAGALTGGDAAAVDAVADRLAGGVLDDGRPPARLHGDLWAGNVLWCAGGAALVDPAAHGGHRETDLAMLALFGLPHLERVLAAYAEAGDLADGWRERVGVHQLHPLLVHAALFGGGYGARAGAVARAALPLLGG
jgi:fructosamine-3-kinase